ncbi:MAG: M20/M25/M40 family metallo-hydrolase [Flavobacteriaceae bacterium]|nr:M20/M25/M40 family metallo-hydrolase [Flavobacteriaceae bacterium]
MRNALYKIGMLAALVISTACNITQSAASEKTIISERDIKAPNPVILEASVKKNLEYLSSNELHGRETGTEGIEEAAVFIEIMFEENNIKPYYKTYRDTFEVGNKTGCNLIGYLEGSDPVLKNEFIILGAHYDHIGVGKVINGDSIANGANDNASGTVGVLELAKHFSKINDNKRSLLFVLFSAEEMGLRGSKQLAEKLNSEGLNLYAMVNFEMIGVPMQDKNYLAYVTGFEGSNLAEKFNEYSNSKILGFLPRANEFKLFERSDNYPFFQEFNVPSQTISTFDFTNYDYYHHVSDEAEKMDFSHISNLIQSVIPGLYKMANTSEKEIKLNQ